MTTYDRNIPQPTDIISESQNQLLMNFMKIATSFERNHQSLDGAPSDGKHTRLEMPEQTTPPETEANEGALYTAQGANMQTGLFWRGESNATPIQLTSGTVTGGGRRFSFNLGGLEFRFGSIDVVAGGPDRVRTINFQTPLATRGYTLLANVLAAETRNAFISGTRFLPAPFDGSGGAKTGCQIQFNDLGDTRFLTGLGIFYLAIGV